MTDQNANLRKDADQILQGIRIVLPGTQALMGFQFIAFMNQSFQTLPQSLKYVHFSALLLTILCSLCLIAPVAFQQIGEDGSATNKFLRFTRVMLAGGMLLLLSSIVADVYLAARMIGFDDNLGYIISGLLFAVGTGLWFIYSLIRRKTPSE